MTMDQSMRMYENNQTREGCKRSAPSTPASRVSKRQRVSTPQEKTPSVIRRSGKRPKTTITFRTPRRMYRTPPPSRGPDRFIPNRANTSVSKARHELVQRLASPSPETTVSGKYRSNIHQALFGTPYTEETRLMSFSVTKPTADYNSVSKIGPFNSPFCHALPSVPTTTMAPSHRKVIPNICSKIDRVFSVDAPGMLEDEDLNLVDFGPCLAIALDDRLYLWDDRKNVDMLTYGRTISCVRWSNDWSYLAIGLEQSVQIWSPNEKRLKMELFHNQGEGFVTAIAWQETEQILLSFDSGILRRHNLQVSGLDSFEYDGHAAHRVTSLVWEDVGIASAAQGIIKVWATNKNTASPLYTMEHSGVSTLAFHPSRPFVLASAGDLGIRLWHIHSGASLGWIRMDFRVLAMHWSPFGVDEIAIVPEGKPLSVWKLVGGSEAVKIKEAPMKGYNDVLSIVGSVDGQVVCTHVGETLTAWSPFSSPLTSPPKYTLPSFGPSIR